MNKCTSASSRLCGGYVSSFLSSAPALRTTQVRLVKVEFSGGNLAKGLGLGRNTYQVRVENPRTK